MKEKIQELIAHYKEAKEECFELLQELNQLSDISMSESEKTVLSNTIIRTESEHAWRVVLISDLENLLF